MFRMKRIVWSTDIHLNFLDQAALDDYIGRLADACPDVVLISGDIAESTDILEYLSVLDDRLDCVICFVLGNHDFYRGSISQVRRDVGRLCDQREKLVYLTGAPCFEISDRVGLVGHDGWGDARFGDYERSLVMLNDYLLIDEFIGLDQRERRPVLNALGDSAAAAVRQSLWPALDQYEHVFFLTHVPPLREACWHNGRISDDQWAPHFTCKAVGDVLLEAAQEFPHRELTVLCGHTHSPGQHCPQPRVNIITGGAEYGFPTINQVFRV